MKQSNIKYIIFAVLCIFSFIFFCFALSLDTAAKAEEFDYEEYNEMYFSDCFGEEEFIIQIKDMLGYVPQMQAYTKGEDAEDSVVAIYFPTTYIEFPIWVDGEGIHFNEEDFFKVIDNENILQYRYQFYSKPGQDWYLFENKKPVSPALQMRGQFEGFRFHPGKVQECTLSFDEMHILLNEDEYKILNDNNVLVSGEALSQVYYNWEMSMIEPEPSAEDEE